jgi:hypothetical protein
MRSVRRHAASALWAVAVAVALLLALGALLANVFSDRDTVVVRSILDAASFVAGPFDGLLDFHHAGTASAPGTHDVPKEDLVNWATAAVVYLVAGRLVDAVVRPRRVTTASPTQPPAADRWNQPGPGADDPSGGPAEPDDAAGGSEAFPQ